MIEVDWNGEGLPPVGLEVEWMPSLQHGWQRVTVLAYSGDDAWIKQLGEPSTIVGNPANFRPIRTTEQIAADEREAAVADMLLLDPYLPGTQLGMMSRQDFCRTLYDAGYRKITDALAERAGQ